MDKILEYYTTQEPDLVEGERVVSTGYDGKTPAGLTGTVVLKWYGTVFGTVCNRWFIGVQFDHIPEKVFGVDIDKKWKSISDLVK